MNCDEFKNAVINNQINDEDFLNHLESCDSCKAFINQELKEPPNGVNPEKWNNLKNNTSEEENINQKDISKINENDKPDSNVDNNKSFLDYYLSGLKYGVVFGLAIVIGFSIIQNKSDNNEITNLEDLNQVKEEEIPPNLISTSTINLNKNIASETISK